MRKLTGTILAWLLLLAIPLQGYAATAMLFCGPGHHGVLAQTGIQPANAEHRHGELLQGHAASSKVGDDTCSAYSAIVSTPYAGHFSAPGSCQIPYAQESFVNHTAERFDPPPKTVLA
ncbi:MAG: hypothetical protein D4R79_09525 [Comamonadaceae bacterium]|nr:MAG: hypothetical protein D4R79_09525 [Comamonadaceae bacterium]